MSSTLHGLHQECATAQDGGRNEAGVVAYREVGCDGDATALWRGRAVPMARIATP
jgi:hypothetical protein